MQLTAEYARSVLSYDPNTGVFMWLRSARKAGWIDKDGYVHIRIGGRAGRLVPAHRLAILMTTGEWPSDRVDHRNRQLGDNRLDNLRPASQSRNRANSSVRCDNRIGVKGVNLLPSGKYRAAIGQRSGARHIGVFDTPEEANSAYLREATLLYGEFACGG